MMNKTELLKLIEEAVTDSAAILTEVEISEGRNTKINITYYDFSGFPQILASKSSMLNLDVD